MKEDDIEQWIERAGLKGVFVPYNSCIEVDLYERQPNGEHWTVEAALRALYRVAAHPTPPAEQEAHND